MCAAEWRRSADAADIPAHDYVAASPVAGDAYRQTWGYDAAARTERSATGAVCYSVRIPSDALTGEACSVVSVAAALVGDRWLDGGAIVSAILSSTETPPPFLDFLAASATTEAMLVPTPAEKPDGAPANWRNLRADATGTLALDVGAASDAWLHICLRVADYLFVYGSWHDGGAMLDPSTIAVTFSRDVAADAPSGTPLDIGRLAADGVGADYALAHLPLASVWCNWAVMADRDAFAGLDAQTDDAIVRNLLSYIYNSPSLYDGRDADTVLAGSGAAFAKHGSAEIMTAGALGWCAIVAHGLTDGGTYRGLALENPINPAGGDITMPYRLLVYAVDASDVSGTPPVATPVPWWGDVISREFRAGRRTAMRCLADPASAPRNIVTTEASSAACRDVAITPLASMDVAGSVDAIAFDAPYTAGELTTILLALIPNGVPALSAEPAAFDISVTRQITGSIPNEGVAASTRTVQTAEIDSAQLNNTSRAQVSLPRSNNGSGIPTVTKQTTTPGKYIWVWASRGTGRFTVRNVRLHITLSGSVTIPDGDYAGEYYILADEWRNVDLSVSYEYFGWDDSIGDMMRIFASASSVSNLRATLNNRASTSEELITLDATIGNVNIELGYPQDYISPTYGELKNVAFAQDPEVRGNTTILTTLTGLDEMVWAARIKYPTGAGVYAFANATIDASVNARVVVAGSAAFVRDGVEYVANLNPSTVTAPYTIRYKSGEPHRYDETPDLSYGIGNQSTFDLPAMSQDLVFRGDDGSLMPASVEIPARASVTPSWAGTAKEIYNGASDALRADITDAIEDGATVDGRGAIQTIDTGLVSLVK